ncbi:hypothetical protein [Streptomyces sp. NPDC001843]|uniref:DUF7848 domain-containing protein n=1 Tax=Streptomyces sp. NPDC001843 TaxID=3364617 RepID=UPI0036803FC8
MTSEVRSYAVPEVEVGDRLVVDNLPFRRWVECASCIDFVGIDPISEAQTWAREHFKPNPRHDRYRVVRRTGWRFLPQYNDKPEAETP